MDIKLILDRYPPSPIKNTPSSSYPISITMTISLQIPYRLEKTRAVGAGCCSPLADIAVESLKISGYGDLARSLC